MEDLGASSVHTSRGCAPGHPQAYANPAAPLQVLYDADGDGTIDHDEYVLSNRLVQRCLLEDFDPHTATDTAEADWLVDAQGHDHLDYGRFTQSWFQLADLWTEGISADQYASFLEDVILCIAELGPDGKLRLRNESDIQTLASLAQDAMVERDVARRAEEEMRAARLREPRKREQRARIRQHWANPPKGFVPVYIPPEHRKATRVESRRRIDIQLNVPNTRTWMLDGDVGVSPADSSMLWHVQGVSQPTHEVRRTHPPSKEAQQDATSLRERVKGERNAQRHAQLQTAPGTAGSEVAGAKLYGKLDDESIVSNPGESAPTSPDLPERRPLVTATYGLRRPHSGTGDRRIDTHGQAYTHVYIPLASGMNIAARERRPSPAQVCGTRDLSRPRSARVSASSGPRIAKVVRPSTAPSARSRPLGPPEQEKAAAAREVFAKIPSAVGPSGSQGSAGTDTDLRGPVDAEAHAIVEVLCTEERRESSTRASEPTRQTAGATTSRDSRPSTATPRIEGSLVRERVARRRQNATPKIGRPQSAPASTSKARYLSVPGGQPINSIIASAATPPDDRQHRLQAEMPHYYADQTGHVRPVAIDCSPRTGVARTGGSSRPPYGARRMKCRKTVSTAGERAAHHLTTRTARPRSLRHDAGPPTVQKPVSAAVQLIGGASPPTSKKQRGWGSGSKQKVVTRSSGRHMPRYR